MFRQTLVIRIVFNGFGKMPTFLRVVFLLDDFRVFCSFDKKAIENTIVENIKKKQMDEQLFGATVMS